MLAKPAPPPKDLRERVKKAAGKDLKRVDWARVDRAGEKRLGIPIRVTTPVPSAAARAD